MWSRSRPQRAETHTSRHHANIPRPWSERASQRHYPWSAMDAVRPDSNVHRQPPSGLTPKWSAAAPQIPTKRCEIPPSFSCNTNTQQTNQRFKLCIYPHSLSYQAQSFLFSSFLGLYRSNFTIDIVQFSEFRGWQSGILNTEPIRKQDNCISNYTCES